MGRRGLEKGKVEEDERIDKMGSAREGLRNELLEEQKY